MNLKSRNLLIIVTRGSTFINLIGLLLFKQQRRVPIKNRGMLTSALNTLRALVKDSKKEIIVKFHVGKVAF